MKLSKIINMSCDIILLNWSLSDSDIGMQIFSETESTYNLFDMLVWQIKNDLQCHQN